MIRVSKEANLPRQVLKTSNVAELLDAHIIPRMARELAEELLTDMHRRGELLSSLSLERLIFPHKFRETISMTLEIPTKADITSRDERIEQLTVERDAARKELDRLRLAVAAKLEADSKLHDAVAFDPF